MKRYSFSVAGILMIVLCLAACKKKYGYSFEDGYNPNGVTDTLKDLVLDTSIYKVDRSQFNSARAFPGLVGIEEPRLKGIEVTLDLDYVVSNNDHLRVSVPPGGYFSTGMYAPAGELIEIVVPVGVYGLTAQIGAWTDNLTGKDPLSRAPIIYSRQELFPGKNLLRNLYGGHVWIIPPRPLGKKITFQFTGVVKSPDFVLGETTTAEWKQMIANTKVPWFELRGKRIIFTLPVNKLADYPINDPQLLMETWDRQVEDGVWKWYGLSPDAADVRDRNAMLPWRIVHDIQPSVGAQHSGYPIVATANENYFKQAVTQTEVVGLNWGTYHEIGHNMQMGSTWNFEGNGEVTCNLFSLKVAKQNGFKHTNYKRMLDAGLAYVSSTGTKNYNATTTSLDARLGMYIQIFERYGYEFMTYLATEARHARFGANNNQDKIDFFYEKLSAYANTDMQPFLTAWGITVSSVSKNKISAQYPLLTEQVWLSNPI
ncbi:M60 family metallopeptidase [Pedobacter sp. SL55]|uniref:M60 family metallopeptidase n=1 Tax=Pedobacter sp. SL55 TaxID=2995161 RepID=UPI002270D6FB|nr:M60 family metallopeptidase [Pedobacter sp. SL55]WAC41299.1 M60 family metallopeptidase [Pedobacter sp. SL55]